eukprot:CAMPEP_0116156582 /NCGR_PEP_ID=MMETSP0329-20121206/22907_1 /TAXON_ID=697910 /ORGANISM="Pseudo-nitzschia arenysensis, Strain B593" /LENGTH=903 /DNA_ID=CAMNT_0003653671 /DNA_START=295 /DNA_END=3006 /DNA_ORIENTATION=+
MRDFAQYTSRLPSPNVRRKGSSPGTTGMVTPKSKSSSPSTTTTTTPASSKRPASPGIDAAIRQLREELKEAMSRDASSKAALSKSDALILDLRSNQRQLKRQLDLLQEERAEMNKELQKAKQNGIGNSSSSSNNAKQEEQIQSLQAHIEDISKQLELSKLKQKQQQNEINNSAHSRGDNNSKNEKVGELQVQLDRAHAQILTADMVRKELEDTLEAEQYTWELRVQDQERQIVKLQQECDTLAQDLDQCRSQWKEAEVGWNQELNELKEELAKARKQLQHQSENGNNNNKNDPQRDLYQKIHQLETERAELQSCLDEALKELEAVDIELQTEGNKGKSPASGNSAQITESLKHLLRWIYQEGPMEARVGHQHLMSLGNNPQEIISLVQKALEDWLEATSQTGNVAGFPGGARGQDQQATIDKLNNQMSVYEKELKIREETSAELRESLKEAVSLLKPLQDAVAKTEEEKIGMRRQLQELETDRQSSQSAMSQQSQRINMLQEQVSGLEEQLREEQRVSSARESLLKAQAQQTKATTSTPSGKGNKDDDSLSNIKRAREELRRKRETESNLQQLLKDAQSRFNTLHDRNENMTARNRELQGQIEKLGTNGEEKHVEEQNGTLAASLAHKEEEIRILRLELERMRITMDNQDASSQKNSVLEEELDFMRRDVAQREHVNRVLNKSLKEALGLLKPLQMHLEEAETEKTEISAELRTLRKRFRQLQMGEGDDHSRSTHTAGAADVSIELIKVRDELEETVRQLELENSQLHDVLDDMTDDGRQNNNEAKFRQRIVELNSRYEVTQNKLENAQVENHALVQALRQKEMEDKKRQEDTMHLQEELRRTETELVNAKRIAQSALVKVEELTMSNIEQLSISRDTSTTADASDSVRSPVNRGKFAGGYHF